MDKAIILSAGQGSRLGKLVDDLMGLAGTADIEVAPLDFIESLFAALVAWWHVAAHLLPSVPSPGAVVGGVLVAQQATGNALLDDALPQATVGDEAGDEDAVVDVRDVLAPLGGHRPGRSAG